MYQLNATQPKSPYATYTDPTIADDSHIFYVGDRDLPVAQRPLPRRTLKIDFAAAAAEHAAIEQRIKEWS